MLGPRKLQQFVDIIERVLCCARLSGIGDGTVTAQSTHTTAAILVNEYQLLLLDGFGWVLAGRAPADARYAHEDFGCPTATMTAEERSKSHAHAGAMALALRSRIRCSR